jgi:hypothetical protein
VKKFAENLQIPIGKVQSQQLKGFLGEDEVGGADETKESLSSRLNAIELAHKRQS